MEIERKLYDWLANAGRVVIVGIGGTLKGDDGVGVEIVRRLKGKTSEMVCPLECGTAPESCLGPIRRFRPTHVLMIDAAELGLQPGSSMLIAPNEVKGFPISTHSLPLGIVAEYLERTTGAKVALLAIQPRQIELGKGLSEEVEKAAELLSRILLRVLPSGEG